MITDSELVALWCLALRGAPPGLVRIFVETFPRDYRAAARA
jgi:hypothetical protein